MLHLSAGVLSHTQRSLVRDEMNLVSPKCMRAFIHTYMHANVQAYTNFYTDSDIGRESIFSGICTYIHLHVYADAGHLV